MSAPKRILCVEDNPDICELIAAILTDYEVISAPGENEAWNRYSSDEFALVVLDYHLIEGNGLDLCKRIRRHETELPIVFITSDPDLSVEMVKEAGGNLLVEKSSPTFIDDVLEAVEKLLGIEPQLVTT